jgi:multidrug resistance efflux pump
MINEEMSEDLRKLRISRADSHPSKKPRNGNKAFISIFAAFTLGIILTALYFRLFAPVNQATTVDVSASRSDAPGASAQSQESPEAYGAPIFTVAGYLIPLVEVEVGSKIIGRIAFLGVERGDIVKQGQVIARLENADLKAQLLQAEAELQVTEKRYDDLIAGSREQEVNQARARLDESAANLRIASVDFERYKRLFQQGVIPAQQLDSAQNLYEIRLAAHKATEQSLDLIKQGPRAESVAVLSAEVERARAQVQFFKSQLRNAYVESPLTGVVMEKLVEAGEIVAPGVGGKGPGIVKIASLKDMRVEADINEGDIRQLRLNQPADVTLDSAPGKSYKGYLARIYPEANRQKGTIKVEVALLETDAVFKPHLSAKVVFKQGSASND